jgi:hypothetical protein
MLAMTATLAAVLVLLGTTVVTGSVGAVVPPSTAHGEHFLFKSALNNAFCISDAAGNTNGRKVTLAGCSTIDTERWTLTEDTDGTNALVDSQGMCVDTTGRVAGDGLAVKVFTCGFGAHQRFRYTAAGLIQATGTTLCLWVPGAAAGAAVSVATCNNASTREMFKLAH